MFKKYDRYPSVLRRPLRGMAKVRLRNGKIMIYEQPMKCCMHPMDWSNSLGYCWGYATAVDDGNEKEFLEKICNPDKCREFF